MLELENSGVYECKSINSSGVKSGTENYRKNGGKVGRMPGFKKTGINF
jgi:hypothetical protein